MRRRSRAVSEVSRGSAILNLENYFPVLLFILFDLETAFFFPWAVALRDLGAYGYLTMFMFVVEFVVGFWYLWKKGALDWE